VFCGKVSQRSSACSSPGEPSRENGVCLIIVKPGRLQRMGKRCAGDVQWPAAPTMTCKCSEHCCTRGPVSGEHCHTRTAIHIAGPTRRDTRPQRDMAVCRAHPAARIGKRLGIGRSSIRALGLRLNARGAASLRRRARFTGKTIPVECSLAGTRMLHVTQRMAFGDEAARRREKRGGIGWLRRS
jgi:hypothetical protein